MAVQYVLSLGLMGLGYLCGSVNFAFVVSKVMGLPDPRSYGSGNPGANNVLRSGSKKAAALTLALDALKAVLPIVLSQFLVRRYGLPEWTPAAVGFAAFLGHLYPVFYGFKGGKGVATALGVLLALQWQVALLGLVVFVAVVALWRYSSLASMSAAVAAPLIYWLGDESTWLLKSSVMLCLVVMAAWLIYSHRENVSRLIQGRESKIGTGKTVQKP